MNVAVLGASPKPDRMSNRAVKILKEKGHRVFPVNPAFEEIEKIHTYKNLYDIKEKIETLTVYINPKNILPLIKDIIELKPERVILNPGTESGELMTELDKNNIPYLKACTIVLLNTNQF